MSNFGPGVFCRKDSLEKIETQHCMDAKGLEPKGFRIPF